MFYGIIINMLIHVFVNKKKSLNECFDIFKIIIIAWKNVIWRDIEENNYSHWLNR